MAQRQAIPAGAAVQYDDTTDPVIPTEVPPALAAPAAADQAQPARQPIPTGASVTYDDQPAPSAPATPWYERAGTDLKQGLLKLQQGATLGLAPAISGAGNAAIQAVKKVVSEGRLPTESEIKQAYTSQRDADQAALDQASKDHPIASTVNELAGSLAIPTGGAAEAAAKPAAGLLGRAVQAVRGLAPAAATGAVAGVGYDRAPEGEIESPGEILTSAAKGAALGAGAAALTRAAGAGLRKLGALGDRSKEQIKQGFIDELSRAETGAKATPTARKQLNQAGEAIWEELTTGPDAKAVKTIVQAPTAQKGLEQLRPIVDRVTQDNAVHYQAFERAGQSAVDVGSEYLPRLEAAEERFRLQGDARMADDLAGIREKMASEAEKTVAASGKKAAGVLLSAASAAQKAGEQDVADALTRVRAGAMSAGGDLVGEAITRLGQAAAKYAKAGQTELANRLTEVGARMSEATKGTDLRWLRSHTTTFQDAAASKLGGLNEHETARVARQVAAHAKEVLDEVIDAKAGSNEELQQAAKNIRANNRRLFGLLSIQDVLASRANNEAPQGGPLEQVGNRIKGAVKGAVAGGTLGGVVGLASGDDSSPGSKAAVGAALGAVGGAANVAPRIGRFFDRRLTGAAIDRLREAATGRGGDPGTVIREVARTYRLPEREARAAYIRLVAGAERHND